jgi:hemoglobin
MKTENDQTMDSRCRTKFIHLCQWCVMLTFVVGMVGCGSAKVGKKKDDFFTSGNRDADQRASQTMAKHEQLTGTGEGSGEKGVKKAKAAKPDEDTTSSAVTNKAALAEGKMALFDRLGGTSGISNIVADFLPRALNDPRVNWQRKDVGGSRFSFRKNRDDKSRWEATPENIATLQKHLVQFLALATGGPAKYDGKEMKPTHADMKIGNPEFDAVIGDLKASLDKLQIPNKEQKELLAIVESTRPQIVTQR